MEIYLVGGAVRDQLLGLPVKERDWVVVGATVEEMLAKGFRPVGKDFPVFLHPQTKEEYALARKERKIGLGYTGFEFNVSPFVTLEEDLMRRDLTINAIAETPEGNIIDPYHGQNDLTKKILRHVSLAFTEDPVRILRVARFAARFGFEVATETIELMRIMVANGEVNALTAERVWKEWERALSEPYPQKFFETLDSCNALAILFPQIKLSDPGLSALQKAANRHADTFLRFAILFYSLKENAINNLCSEYRVPNDYRDFALLLNSCLPLYLQASHLNALEFLNFLMKLDAFRRESRFKDFLLAAEICVGYSTHSHLILQCFAAAKAIDTTELVKKASGHQIASAIQSARCDAIQRCLSTLDISE